MTTGKSQFLLAGAACVGLLAFSGSALAQATATRPAATAAAAPAAQIPSGPAIPGVCVFWTEGAIGSSAVGKAVNARMQQLSSTANAEIGAEKTSIETDGKALDTQKATLSQDVYGQRAQALNQRISLLQRKAQIRSQELEATEQKAVARVETEMSPLLRQVYSQKGCGLLIERSAVLGSNPSMDITGDVIKLLDAKITTFAFDREHLEQQPGAAPAAARPGG